MQLRKRQKASQDGRRQQERSGRARGKGTVADRILALIQLLGLSTEVHLIVVHATMAVVTVHETPHHAVKAVAVHARLRHATVLITAPLRHVSTASRGELAASQARHYLQSEVVCLEDVCGLHSLVHGYAVLEPDDAVPSCLIHVAGLEVLSNYMSALQANENEGQQLLQQPHSRDQTTDTHCLGGLARDARYVETNCLHQKNKDIVLT